MIADRIKRRLMGVKHTVAIHRTAFCANCNDVRRFVYVGEQHWPEQVAKVAGLPRVVQLWQCCGCNTTVTRCLEP